MGMLGFALQRSPQTSLFEDAKSPNSEAGNFEKLCRLTYMSTMRGDQATASRHIETIAAQSVLKNIQRNVSGHMLYDADVKQVWQVIEGNEETIQRLWMGISNDARHVIDDESVKHEMVDTRRYPLGWGTRYTKFQKGHGSDKDIVSDLKPLKCSDVELVQVKYKSFLKDQDAAQKQIMDDVIPKAIVENAKREITGFLLYNDNTTTVYQVLEGPASVVELLFNKICKDPRHCVCKDSVQRVRVQEREFPNWSMALEHVGQPIWASAAGY